VFRKRFDNEISHDRQELRDYFADRLRLALDFATLGAYELTEAEGELAAAGPEPPKPAERAESRHCANAAQRTQRRHVSDASLPCPAPADGRRAPASCERGGRRAGGVPTPAQPCTCAGR
jgi:hypothetical protein